MSQHRYRHVASNIIIACVGYGYICTIFVIEKLDAACPKIRDAPLDLVGGGLGTDFFLCFVQILLHVFPIYFCTLHILVNIFFINFVNKLFFCHIFNKLFF